VLGFVPVFEMAPGDELCYNQGNLTRRNVSSIVRQLGTEFREHTLAPWAVGSVDSRRTRLPTLPTAPTTAMAC
jgi:hypothetical protein